jgi:methylamine dehydrogenase accessory protein MauD
MPQVVWYCNSALRSRFGPRLRRDAADDTGMSDLLAALAAMTLGEVLLVAGVSKLADPSGSRRAVADFGVPSRFSPAVGLLVPVLELGTAAVLFSGYGARFAGLAAVTLLLAFAAAIAVNMARGRHPDCHCFGQLHSAPAGLRTLARNGLLALVAGLVTWRAWSGDAPLDWGELGAGTLAIALALSAFLTLLVVRGDLVVRLARRNESARRALDALETAVYRYRVARARRDEGLEVGASAPGFKLPSLHGDSVTLDDLLQHGHPVLLLFGDPTCVVCGELLPEAAAWHRSHASELTLAVITRGAPEENAAKIEGHPPDRVLFQAGHEVDGAFRLKGTPTAVLLSPDGSIASTPAAGADEIRELLSSTTTSSRAALTA